MHESHWHDGILPHWHISVWLFWGIVIATVIWIFFRNKKSRNKEE